MSSIQGSIAKVFEDIEDYLENQKALFGDEFYSDRNIDDLWKIPTRTREQLLKEFSQSIQNCQRCGLAESRRHVVFGNGNPNARIMLVGEAPGREEDIQGKVFVGAAGQLLTKILAAINLKRDDVYIGNIIKCRPPQNRNPNQEEQDTCAEYLMKQIDIIQPHYILALGRIAGQYLTGKSLSMRELRGNVFSFKGASLMVTYHPAALLRNPELKRPTWEDVQKFQKLYEQ